MRVARVLGVCAVLLSSACGGGGAENAPIGGGDGDIPVGDGDMMGDGDAPQVGPVVEVVSPTAATDPTTDPVIVGSSVDVTCKVTAREGGAAVDPASVMAEVYLPGETEAVVTQAATAMGVDMFKASVPLALVVGGPVKVGCAAKDVGMPAQVGSSTVDTFYDSGPVVEFTALMDGSVVPLGSDDAPDVTIQFSVEPLLLKEGDTGAAIASVVLDIDGEQVEATLDEETQTYVYPLDFQTRFAGAPVSAAGVTVIATNSRMPTPAESKSVIGLTVDGKGPAIKIVSPVGKGGLAPIVGSQVDVVLEVTDAESGVSKDPGKLYATIAYQGEEIKYDLEAMGSSSKQFKFTFFAAQFENTANVTANIHVEDLAGNVGTVAHTMRFDTVAPWLSFNPPDMRNFVGDARECTTSYDPLGDSPIDGQIVALETRIRTLIWDRATTIEGATELWYAGIDNESTKLMAIEATGEPLLINKVEDAENLCDTVAAVGREFRLDPVKPAGSRAAAATLDTPPDPNEYTPAACVPADKDGEEPKDVCDGSGMNYVLNHSVGSNVPAVYATKPSTTGLGCTGTSIDLQTTAGWVCLVAVGRDLAGNVGFSAPIRVCRRSGPDDCPGELGEVVEPPPEFTCTDGCTLPASVAEVDVPLFHEQ